MRSTLTTTAGSLFYRYEDWNNYMDIYSVTNKVSHDVSNRNGYPDQECFTATER